MKPTASQIPRLALLAAGVISNSMLLHAETLNFDGIQASGTTSHTIPATDWADYLGGSGTFNGANQGGRLYWRGSAGDGQYMHFNLSSLSGLTVVTPAYVTLQNSYANWGGGVDGSFVATANGAWTAAGGQTVPGATAVAGAVHAAGYYGTNVDASWNGSSMSWGIGGTVLQGLVGSSGYYGLAVIGGSDSTLHFNSSMAPYLTVKTGTLSGSNVAGVITVTGGGAWNAGNYSFVAGDSYSAAASLRINGTVTGGTSGAGAVTIHGGNVLVNQAGAVDNLYWAIDSTTINPGGTLTINGHSHIHNLTLAGGELGSTGVSGKWGGWSFDDATTVTGGVTSILSARQLNLDNGNFTVDTGSTLDFSGSIRSGSIIKGGGGDIVLTGSNGFSGGITINGGTINAARSAQDHGIHTLGSGPLTINNGGILRSTAQWSTSSEWNGTTVGAVTINQGGTWSIEAVGQTIRNGLYLNGGSIAGSVSHGDWGALHLKSGVTAGGNAVSSIGVDTALSGTQTLTVDGGSQMNYSGVLHNQYNTTSGITKAGAGTLVLSGNNSYTGVTTIENGVVNATTFSNFGVNGSLGYRSADATENVGILFRGGTLQYTGPTPQSTNRGIRISTTGGATIDASGSVPTATLSFTATASVNFFENPGARTLTLTGSNPGDNTFAMSIEEAGGATTVVKRGAGRWVLSGNNTYSGVTSVEEGTLLINGVHTGGGLITVSAAATLGGGGQAGAVDMWTAGTLAPGDSVRGDNWLQVGALSLGDTTTILDFELGAPDDGGTPLAANDLLIASSLPYLRGVVNVIPRTGFAASPIGSKWRLIELTDGTVPADQELTLAPALTGQYSLQALEGDNAVYLVAVPEAGTAGLMALAAALLRCLRQPGRSNRRIQRSGMS